MTGADGLRSLPSRWCPPWSGRGRILAAAFLWVKSPVWVTDDVWFTCIISIPHNTNATFYSLFAAFRKILRYFYTFVWHGSPSPFFTLLSWGAEALISHSPHVLFFICVNSNFLDPCKREDEVVDLPASANKTRELLSGVWANLTRIRVLWKCVRFGQSRKKSLLFSYNSRKAHVPKGVGTKGRDLL